MPPLSLSVRLVRGVAVLALLVPSAAGAWAQTGRSGLVDTTSADTTRAVTEPDVLAPDSTASGGALADSVAADSVALAEAAVPEVVPPLPAPTLHAFADGLRVTLAAGWDGPATVAATPAGAVYRFQNDAAGHPLQGVVLRVERVDGLNALFRERWSRGLTTSGYAGMTPVGPAAAPLPGFGVEVAGDGRGGAVVFVQRGASSWAVGVSAPAAQWARQRAEVLAVLADVALP